MNKPKPKTRTALDWFECTSFIEDKYKIQTRDYAGSHGDFTRWCKQAGEKPVDSPPGCSDEIMKACQEQYSRYKKEVATGKFKENPYQDFWHWLTDVTAVHRGGTIELYPEMGDGAKPWQKEILGLYLKEFGKGPYLADW